MVKCSNTFMSFSDSPTEALLKVPEPAVRRLPIVVVDEIVIRQDFRRAVVQALGTQIKEVLRKSIPVRQL